MSRARFADTLLAAYRGDEVIGVATAGEWQEYLGVRMETVIYMSTPTFHNRKHREGTVLLYRLDREYEN